jgi:hypothetical protein
MRARNDRRRDDRRQWRVRSDLVERGVSAMTRSSTVGEPGIAGGGALDRCNERVAVLRRCLDVPRLSASSLSAARISRMPRFSPCSKLTAVLLPQTCSCSSSA